MDVNQEASAPYGASGSGSVFFPGVNGTIPREGMLFRSGHMGEGLGSAQHDVVEFEEPPWRALPSMGSGAGEGSVGGRGEREKGLTYEIIIL